MVRAILGVIILVIVVPVFWVICSGGDMSEAESEQHLIVPLVFTSVLSGLLLGIAIGGLYLGRF